MGPIETLVEKIIADAIAQAFLLFMQNLPAILSQIKLANSNTAVIAPPATPADLDAAQRAARDAIGTNNLPPLP